MKYRIKDAYEKEEISEFELQNDSDSDMSPQMTLLINGFNLMIFRKDKVISIYKNQLKEMGFTLEIKD